ncbi:hypothetical protein EDC01DRAFT_662831 [Geopyxis carbonaria]|nr:hypothetical protein EDC01DRAFT_662831 [Geopyxis carbonaria]
MTVLFIFLSIYFIFVLFSFQALFFLFYLRHSVNWFSGGSVNLFLWFSSCFFHVTAIKKGVYGDF